MSLKALFKMPFPQDCEWKKTMLWLSQTWSQKTRAVPQDCLWFTAVLASEEQKDIGRFPKVGTINTSLDHRCVKRGAPK